MPLRDSAKNELFALIVVGAKLALAQEARPSMGLSMQPDTRYAKSGDVHIAYQVFGEGPINLVLASPFVSNVEHCGMSRTLLVGSCVWRALRGW